MTLRARPRDFYRIRESEKTKLSGFPCGKRAAGYACPMNFMNAGHNEKRQRESIAVLVGLTVLLSIPLFQSLSQQYTDFGAHLEFASSLLRTGSTSLPHFLFQFGIAFLYTLGLSLTGSAVVLSTIAMVATALVLYFIMKDAAEPWVAASLALALLVVGPLSLITLPESELYLGYMTPGVFHSPTFVLLKPAALGLLIVGSRAFDENVGAPRWGLVATAAGLSVFSCLSKPSFQICFLPGLGLLVALALLRKTAVDLRLCVLGIALPSMLVLGWQFFVGFSQVQTSGIFFSPFEVIEFLADRVFLKFLLSVFFPVLVTAVFFQDARRDSRLTIAWSTTFFGLFYAYFLAESGARFPHGNFLWSGYIAVFVLYVACVPLLLRQPKSIAQKICWAVLGLQVLSGAIFFFGQMQGSRYGEWW